MGYSQAGFAEIVGVDNRPQPRYPFPFVQGDALEYLAAHGREYDVIHASPPCQAYSALKHLARKPHPALVEATRRGLQATGKPYVIENVVGAPLHFPLLLCGTMFALETPCGAQLRRHRLFESSHYIMAPGECAHGQTTSGVHSYDVRNEATRDAKRRTISIHGDHPRDRRVRWGTGRTITVTGSTPQQNVERNRLRETFSVAEAQIAMGIDWMGMQALSQAVPPAYTHWIGQQLLTALQRCAARSEERRSTTY
jgi:DNA (cytosine-5)-methyltransferase 1